MRISKSPYAWIVFGIIFYSYMTTFQTVLFGSRMGGVIFVIVLTLFGIYFQFKKGVRKISDGRLFWFALLLFSVFGNQDLANGTETRWILPMVGILLLFVLAGTYSWQDTFVKSVRIFTGIHAFFTLFFYIFKGLYLHFFIKLIPNAGTYLVAKFNDGGMPGITGHYSTNGIYLGIGFVFFACNLIIHNYTTNKRQYYIEIAKTLFVLLALILTTKRAHLLFGIAACFVIYYIYNSNKKVSRWFYIMLAVMGLAVCIVFMMPFVPAISRVINRFIYADGGEITNGRIWFYVFALEKFQENPMVGIGWGGFKHAYYERIGTYAETSKYVDAHNVYLQMLCEQGVIGALLFLGGVLSAFTKTWKLLKQTRLNRLKCIDFAKERYLTISVGIQSFFIMYCFTGNCLYDCEFFFVYILCCALTYGISDYLRC